MRRVILFSATFGGFLTAGAALLSGAVVAVLALLDAGVIRETRVLAAFTLALVVFGAGLGLTLAWHGWRSLGGRASRRCGLPAWGWWLLAFVLVLAGGQLLVASGSDTLLPVFHLLAAALPALLFLALAVGGARRTGRVLTTRPITASLAWGGLGGVGLALLSELALIAGLLLILPPLIELAVPGFMADVRAVFAAVQRTGELDLGALSGYLDSPWLLLGGLLLGAGLAPLIEEVVKSLAVPLLVLTGRRLTRVEAFLTGVAAGAGFAMVEGVTNGSLALAQPETWATAMAARGGAAALHCIVSGLAGLGWHALLVERRWWRGVGLAAAAVAFHGLWNVGALGSTWLALQRGGALAAVGNLANIPIVALMGAQFVIALALLRGLPARLAEPVRPAPAETPGEPAT